MNHARSSASTASQLLSDLEGISGSGPFGWSIDVSPVQIDRSVLDHKIILRYYEQGEYQATRTVTISPEWSMHPRYGEPDVFLGYKVTDTDYDEEFDNVIARHLRFDEATETVSDRLTTQYQRGPHRVTDWRSLRRMAKHGDAEQVSNYAVFADVVGHSIKLFVEYYNDEKEDTWEPIEYDDVLSDHGVNQVLGRALEEDTMVDFKQLASLRLVAEDIMDE